ncbi:MAG: DUF3426 domain-containing protein [Pseudomonadota bacterium]
MLARCPHCGIAHAVARSPDLHHGRVRCNACGGTFELFAALEIGGAGVPAEGPGFTPVVAHGRPRIASTVHAAHAALDIETGPATLPPLTAAGTRRWPTALAGLGLTATLILQMLLVPPFAPGTSARVDHLRGLLCDAWPCPHWSAPSAIRVSPPQWTEDPVRMRLRVDFELQSAVPQPWPGLEVVLSDALGTEHGQLWLPPEAYRPSTPPRLEPGRIWTVSLTLEPPHPQISGVQVTAR